MKPKYIPTKEIQFMAKSGFITWELWNEFFAYGCQAWRYRLWNQFIAEKIFFERRSENTFDVWVLNRKHQLVKNTVGSVVASPPFTGQLRHDQLVAKFILETMRQGLGIAYRLEPELKKMAPKIVRHYDSSNREKYPDGLIQLKDTEKTRVALELELTRKDPKRYRQILDAYSSYKKAELVVFIVQDERFITTIKQAMRDSYYPKYERPIGFSRLEDWQKNPTEAKIQFSEKTTTLESIVRHNEKVAA
jgi:hypothetical protein